ncbi:V-snare-domain-containing protein [Nadsonia fulvescens var. elongata DSM 6958]|uniref:V-snare-domain-containing protein n=1 Tax=Nadsonia fulvescens var. elongata DSM 6958 TaxID=857566 RepID=A0A1E3PIH9_9ASCO|nr:V-snare-domain-containing protein [Nadsonia fulvescens var. elongata DSM 6958]
MSGIEPPSDLFASYESDFNLLYGEINQKLDSEFVAATTPENKKTILRSLERSIDESYEILDQLSIEVQNISTSRRASYNTIIRKYRKDIDDVKRRVKDLVIETGRAELFGSRYQPTKGDNSLDSDISLDQRQQLLSGQASLDRSSQRLRDSQRIANETESIGANILTDLRGQREQIVNSRNTLLEADGYVDKSLKTLKTMGRRMAANKLITYAIIAVLIILILLVLYGKFN